MAHLASKRRSIFKNDSTYGQCGRKTSMKSLCKRNEIGVRSNMMLFAVMIENTYNSDRKKMVTTTFLQDQNLGFVINLSFRNEHTKNELIYILSSTRLANIPKIRNFNHSVPGLHEVAEIVTKDGTFFIYSNQMVDIPVHVTLQSLLENLENIILEQKAIENSFEAYPQLPAIVECGHTSFENCNTYNETRFWHANLFGDIHAVDDSRDTNLHKAVRAENVELVRYLLLKEANINAFNIYGETALHLASRIGSYPLVKILIEHRADAYVFDNNGYTPLHISVMRGDLWIVKLLLIDKCIVQATDFQYRTPLHHAASRNLKDISLELILNQAPINCPDVRGRTPLHLACKKNHTDVVQSLVEKGANVNFRDLSGDTALSLACQKGHIETIAQLVRARANIDYPNQDFDTPLHKATRHGRKSVIEYLLQNRASIDFPNKYDSTPLHVALEGQNVELAKYLIEKGADVNLEDKLKKSPLFIYIEKRLSEKDKDRQLYNLLKSKGAVSRNEYYERNRKLFVPEKRNKMAEKLWMKINNMKKGCAVL